MKKYLLAVLFFAASFFALTAQEAPQNSIRFYTESDFSVSFDADWQLDTPRIAGSPFFLFSKPEISQRSGCELHKHAITGSKNKSRLKFLQFVFIKEGKAYVLTFTGEQKKFDDYPERATNILNSLIVQLYV